MARRVRDRQAPPTQATTYECAFLFGTPLAPWLGVQELGRLKSFARSVQAQLSNASEFCGWLRIRHLGRVDRRVKTDALLGQARSVAASVRERQPCQTMAGDDELEIQFEPLDAAQTAERLDERGPGWREQAGSLGVDLAQLRRATEHGSTGDMDGPSVEPRKLPPTPVETDPNPLEGATIRPPRLRRPPSTADATAKLQHLLRRVREHPPQLPGRRALTEDAQTLQSIVQMYQKEVPRSRAARQRMVDQLNEAMVRLHVRILMLDGRPAKLYLSKSSGAGNVQFIAGKGGEGSFKNSSPVILAHYPY